MSGRQSNQLPNNLPQLQNLIKRDAESYKEEFQQQFLHFQSTLAVFELTPDQFNDSLDELIMFLAQVSKCYQEELSTFPTSLVSLLERHSTVLHPSMHALSMSRSHSSQEQVSDRAITTAQAFLPVAPLPGQVPEVLISNTYGQNIDLTLSKVPGLSSRTTL